METSQKSSVHQGKKRKRTADNRLSESVRKYSELDLSQEESVTVTDSHKKVCFGLAIGQGNSGVQSNRILLEIFKMCSPADVLQSLSFVNRQWMKTCGSNELSKELWYTFLEILCIPFDRCTQPRATYAAYIRQQQTVVDVRKDRIHVLNKTTGVWTSTRLSEPMKLESSSYAIMFDGSLLCCSGAVYLGRESGYQYPVHRIALDGQLSALKPMITGRESHGIAAYGRKVFVFGGLSSGQELLTIEMYTESSWSELPFKLTVPHYYFIPCIYKGLIYLNGSFRQPMEVFNPSSLTVDVVDNSTLHEDCAAVTGYEGRLVVIGQKSVWKWNSETTHSEVTPIPEFSFLGFEKRAVLQGDLLYILTSKALLNINMKTFSCEYRPKYEV